MKPKLQTKDLDPETLRWCAQTVRRINRRGYSYVFSKTVALEGACNSFVRYAKRNETRKR